VWAVLDGAGTVRVSIETSEASAEAVASEIEVSHPGAYPLVEHERHTTGTLALEIGPGVRCLATCFTPGLA
jgi:hypothetical protein